jgi:GTPase Era involved in 16S rRNA processing
MSLTAIVEKINAFQSFLNKLTNLNYLNELKFSDDQANLSRLNEQISKHRFEVAVIGEFSTGKSTFINALLNEDILPATYRPTTNQLMRIQHDDINKRVYIDGTNPEIDGLPLTKETIKKLDSDTDGLIVIDTKIPAPMDQFLIYDTPGVNDPSALSEEIVFDLLSKVDVVIFILRADSALKETEINFLQQLVLKKDLGKFFFVINFADGLSLNDANDVRDHVIKNIGHLVQWPIKELNERVFLHSAKQVLNNSNHKELVSVDQLDYGSMHKKLLQSIQVFSESGYVELMTEFLENRIKEIAKSITDKLSAAIDSAQGKDDDYLEALAQINAEINSFRHEIHANELAFRSEIRTKKYALIKNIEAEFNEIRIEVKATVIESSEQNLTSTDWMQKYIRKLIEDKVPPVLDNFVIEIKQITDDFDQKILPVLIKSIGKVEGINKSFDFSSIFAATGVGAVGYALLATALPWVMGAFGIVAGGSVALSFIPGVGTAFGAVLGMGLKSSVSGLVNVVSEGAGVLGIAYKNIRDKTHMWLEQKDKQQYLAGLEKIIGDLESALIAQLETTIVPEEISASVIDSKFPHKQEIINKQKQQIFIDRKLLVSNIDEMILIRQELLTKLIA